MDGFIVRVIAYYGEPVKVGGLPIRAGASRDTPLIDSDIVNDFDRQGSIVDLVGGTPQKKSDYNVDQLIADFEDEYECKVNYDLDKKVVRDGTEVHEFDVFEPSWSDQCSAQDVIDDLMERLTDWCKGFPTGM